jgi:hypothetical protein
VTALTDPYAAATAPASAMLNLFFRIKKAYNGIIMASETEATSVTPTSLVNPLCANSSPPLNPIENNKYSEINLEELAGISKSLFTTAAITPNKKNSNVGLVKLLISISKFMRDAK